MKLKTAYLLLFVCLLCQHLCAQICPPNIDFELGDFSNWECSIGNTTVRGGQNVITLNPSPPIPGRHEIITNRSAAQMDFYGNFPTLCPYGGKYSVKLGNASVGAEAEGISYTFTIPATLDTFTFTYFYAVVFEDPSHSIFEQPRFFVTAYDVATGDLVNCASYNYVSNGTLPGFERSPAQSNVLFKNWSPTSLQFAGLAGKTVRLEFKTADCTLGGHFGYAYLDVGSGCSNILATAPYCIETNSLLLNAPYGFDRYTWYNEDYTVVLGNQQSLTLSPPPATSGIFHVDAIPYPGYGCRDTFDAVVTPLPVPDTPSAKINYTYCQFDIASSLTATALPGNELLWYTTATGGIANTRAPIPSTAVPGSTDYYVSQKILFGCESFRKKITVKILPTPSASFVSNAARQCQKDNQYIFTSASTNLSDAVYNWDFGNGITRSSATDSIANYSYPGYGNFIVKLKVVNGGVCSSEKTLPVTVVPKPISAFDYPSTICQNQTTVAVIDKSNVPGGASTINNWWWSFNNTIVRRQNPNSFVPSSAGNLTIKLVTRTTEGCGSDTASIVTPVHHQPNAVFKYGKLLCNNETIQFTNLSALPTSATGEAIVKWNWQFTNSGSMNTPNPSTNFSPGIHRARLMTETNFGCRSTVADSIFEIHAKPNIQLLINDSCVNRIINYRANDLLNTVDKWYWNFGNGLYNSSSVISKTYNRKTDIPITLMAQTIHGCKDTIIRPFAIYDNKAVAFRDTIAAWDEPVQLKANGYEQTKYIWSPSTGLNNDSIENPIATLEREQTYLLNTITKEGCDRSSKVVVKRYKGPELYVPNAFTPNNDGNNDLLKVFPIGIKTFQYLAIYDRYGKLIFKTTDYSKGWDGTFNGQQLNAGTFVYLAQAIDYKNRPITRKGTIILIR
jgi:gliding motility-associated-like protein